jgi:Protein of unknown function (DUF3124)
LRYIYWGFPILLRRVGLFLITMFLMGACTSPDMQQTSMQSPDQTTSNMTVLEKIKNPAMGQTLYVPIYSHIYSEDHKSMINLTATLSIRNTDLAQNLIINSVRYYDSDGQQVRQYLEQPILLKALASKDFVIPRTDTTGGAGANFIVEWVAQQKISEPIIEAVMIGTEGNRGFSFVSSARIIDRVNLPKPAQ